MKMWRGVWCTMERPTCRMCLGIRRTWLVRWEEGAKEKLIAQWKKHGGMDWIVVLIVLLVYSYAMIFRAFTSNCCSPLPLSILPVTPKLLH